MHLSCSYGFDSPTMLTITMSNWFSTWVHIGWWRMPCTWLGFRQPVNISNMLKGLQWPRMMGPRYNTSPRISTPRFVLIGLSMDLLEYESVLIRAYLCRWWSRGCLTSWTPTWLGVSIGLRKASTRHRLSTGSVEEQTRTTHSVVTTSRGRLNVS